MPTVYLVMAGVLVAGLLGGGCGYLVGASGSAEDVIACARAREEQAIAYAEGWKNAVEQTQQAAIEEARRAMQAQARRDALLDAEKEVLHEAANSDHLAGCDWTTDFRMHVDALYKLNGYAPSGARDPDGVPHALPFAARDDAAAGGVGTGSAGVGLQLRTPAQ